MSRWNDKDRKNKVRSDAKYNTKTAAIVIRLLAAGFTFEDAGYAIGVRETTIQSWVQRYPVFKKQIEKVKEAVKAITYAQLLRAAWGYDYEEVKEEYETPSGLVLPVKDGKVQSVEMGQLNEPIIKKVTVTKKHQAPNGDLIKFILLNRDKKNWRDIKNIDIRATNIAPELLGKAEADQIAEIAGGLTKQIESTEVKKEVDGNSEDKDSSTVLSDNTQKCSEEHSISDKSTQ